MSQLSSASALLNSLHYGTKLFLDCVIYVLCYFHQDTNDHAGLNQS